MRGVFLFEQSHRTSGGGEADSDHGAGKTCSDNEVVESLRKLGHGEVLSGCGFRRETQRRAGVKGCMRMLTSCRPAARQMRCQSSGTKERAIETGPSCWTKGWSLARLEKTRKKW